jgi:hypothetical protein
VTRRDLLFGIFAAVVVSVITLLPQIYLCYQRGSDWNGQYALFDSDEIAYAAYVRALMDHRPRRNDPYTGLDNTQAETLYSIQFIPAYSIAIPARLARISASTAFIVLSVSVAFASSIVLFCILFDLLGDGLLSAFGAVTILLMAGFAGAAPWNFFAPHVSFPFLRRYLPAFPFPFFFAMVWFMWRALTRNSWMWAVLASISLPIQIYSYFFVWTAAAAWILTLAVLWLATQPVRRYLWRVFGTVAAVAAMALIPYISLLRHRAAVTDDAQLLEFTHAPDLLRGPEVYGFLIALILVRRGWRNPKTVFALSIALAPFVIFNQQILTGRSLQPFHYEQFITNYSVLLAGVFAVASSRAIARRVQIYGGIIFLLLGFAYSAAIAERTFDFSREVDKARAAALRLNGPGTVFATNRYLITTVPAVTSNPVLWARYMYTFSNVDRTQQKFRFYKYLYFSGATKEDVRRLLERPDAAVRQDVFGAERANPMLTTQPLTITSQDIESAVDEYVRFTLTIDRREATTPVLSYAIVQPNDDLANLDKWYQRDAGERVGEFTIYRLTVR